MNIIEPLKPEEMKGHLGGPSVESLKLFRRDKLTILCDMDAILVDLTPYWLRLIAERHGVTETIHNITQWNLHKCGNLIPLGAKPIYDFLQDEGFFRNAPEIPTALSRLRELHDLGHNVFILSSPSGPISAKEKLEWLAEKAPWLKPEKIGLWNMKTMVKADVLIDDHPDTLREYSEKHLESLCVGIRYPYNENKDLGRALVVDSYTDYAKAWTEIFFLIEAAATQRVQ